MEKGRCLIHEEIEREKIKIKDKVDEGSSSVVEPKTSEVEEYNPDDPLIPLAPTPPVVGTTMPNLGDESAEGISIFSPQFIKVIVTCRHLMG